jgi:hypothetical protein
VSSTTTTTATPRDAQLRAYEAKQHLPLVARCPNVNEHGERCTTLTAPGYTGRAGGWCSWHDPSLKARRMNDRAAWTLPPLGTATD